MAIIDNSRGNAADVGLSPGGASVVPFMLGTNRYKEQIFSDSVQLGDNQVERVFNITPGGFLRGVRLSVRATGAVETDPVFVNPGQYPWDVFSMISLENVDGSYILYPMIGSNYAMAMGSGRPWNSSAALRASFVNTSANLSFDLLFSNEVRDTLGVLANTDARAQYRLRYRLNTASALFASGVTTPPVVTVTGIGEYWAQTDTQDLNGNPIQAVPDGLCGAHIIRHQVLPLSAGNNTIQCTNTGNEIRVLNVVTRDANGIRFNAFADLDPIRLRLDNRTLENTSRREVLQEMTDFYSNIFGLGTAVRNVQPGVYIWPRFTRPGHGYGDSGWMGTSNATYLVIEGNATFTTANPGPGTIDIVTDEIIPVAPIPPHLEGI